ncbi:MAG: amino acid--tRNA ligase-related protein, partial [Acidobacteriota bacterium]
CGKGLEFFGRDLKIPEQPFEKISHQEAVRRYGADYETELSQKAAEPIWILGFPMGDREFYDREYPEQPGILVDMDLIYPEGFGEALSGGEREYQHDKIKKRIEQKK